MTQIEPPAVARFRTFLSTRTGLNFDEGKLEFLDGVLCECAAAAGARTIDEYLVRLSNLNVRDPHFQALIERLTVGETYFFRNPDQYRALESIALPECVRSGGPFRIVSAGCATGEEPYSVAILIRELFPAISPAHIQIQALDINASALARARKGSYSAWSLRATPEPLKQRWFQPEGKNFTVGDAIREAVTFETLNLADEALHFWSPQSIDVLFCCNVTMYFAASTTKNIVARFARALRPGGYLFLGHAESLRGLSQDFRLRHTHNTFYYQRCPAAEAALNARSASSSHWPSVPEPPRAGDDSWFDIIRRTSARIELLTQSRPESAPVDAEPPSPPVATPAPDLAGILNLLAEERFVDALRAFDALREAQRAETDARLLRAVILANAGQLMDAQQACTEILELDEQQPGAHYLLGVCSAHAGDHAAARENHRAAIYFDPEFAMPHLQLGVLARRAGDWNEARRELAWAERLLAGEDSARILLYGGGFGREALIALCRSELRALEARDE